MMSLSRFLRLCFALTLVTAHAQEKYRVGDSFAGFTTTDQHGQTYTYDGSARIIVVAFAMSPGKAANTFFAAQPAGFLAQHHALFISNIHGMPGIARAFALPKMRKYPHRILLADGETFLARYPEKEDHLTMLRLDEKGTITAIAYVQPKKELGAVFAP